MNEDVIKEAGAETIQEKLILKQIENNKSEAKELLNNSDKMEQFLDKLEKKLALIPMAGSLLSDVPVLISMVKAYIEKKYTAVPVGSIVAIIAALIYVLSPIDLIPDIIPGVGIIDDAAVIALALKLVHDDLVDYRTWRDANLQH